MAENITEWLESIGLSKYATLFAGNGIDLDILGELKESDLEKLGIALGDRKRLLKAIATLSTDSPTLAATQRASSRPAPALEAQRRQLTVMFCDLVGSTALSRRLDPEDLREAVRGYQQLCAGIVARLDGFVAQFLGDGILIYFGWPRAHENDAERAVRAGLGIVEAMQGAEAPKAGGEPLSVRIGIATGPVVVGDLTGSAAGTEATATGETPNLAARLQELAPVNGIVIAPSTYALAGALFECLDLSERQFKGFQTPLSVWRVIRERATESRFEAVRADRLVPFVGREHEIGLMLGRWQEAKAGEGQVVLLSGEAGIGKSRIAQTLRERIASEPHIRLRYQCSPYYTSTAFHPFITQLERAAGFTPEDTAETKLGKIEAIVAAGGAATSEVAPFLASLLSVPLGDRYPPLDMPAQPLKARIIAALTAQLVGLAVRQPVLLVFEDAHWADPTSLEVLDQTLGRMSNLRVLVLVTARPEFEGRWSQHAHATLLTLNRLSRRQSGVLVERVTGGKSLPREVLDQIIAKTDGVPLFVEELTRTVLESGLLADRGSRYELTGPLPPLAIPATLQDSLMARLDRLDAVKELAQIGAAIGREFPHKLLSAVAPLRGVALEDGLSRLVASGLVFRQGSGETARYVFKHALVQDAAYASMLKSRRQMLHQEIAAALDDNFPDVADVTPEILAHHCTEAGLTEQAIKCWQKAGELAVKRSADVEAMSHYAKALDLLMTQPQSEARGDIELRIRTGLMTPLMITKGVAAEETAANVSRAAAVAERRDNISEHVPVLYGHWMVTSTRGNVVEGLRIAEGMAKRSEREDNEVLRLVAYQVLGISKFCLGRFREARGEFERSDAVYDAARHGLLRYAYSGVDFRANNNCFFAVADRFCGRLGSAGRAAQQTLDLVRPLNHVGTLCHCLAMLTVGNTQFFSCDDHERHARELADLASKHGLEHYEAMGSAAIAEALGHAGKYSDAVRVGDGAWALWKAVGLRTLTTGFLAGLAEWHCYAGSAAAGLGVLSEAQAIIEGDGGERLFEAEVWRVRGKLLSASNDDAAAEASYHQALEVARAQDAKPFELRASRDLATLWKRQGRTAEARDLLAPIYGWFTEGFETVDLKSAKALLDELQGQAA